MEKEKDGVWRTIRGRRIFIGKGEDLATAMKKSGKFNDNGRLPKREDYHKAKKQLALEEANEKENKAYDYVYKKPKDEKQREQWKKKADKATENRIKAHKEYNEYMDLYDKDRDDSELTWQDKAEKIHRQGEKIRESKSPRDSDYYDTYRNEEVEFAKIKEEPDDAPYESLPAYKTYQEKMMKLEKDNKSWTGKEYTNDEFMEHLTDANWHAERKMIEEAGLTNKQMTELKNQVRLSSWSANLDKKSTQELIDKVKKEFPAKDTKKAIEDFKTKKQSNNKIDKEYHFAGEELYSDDPHRYDNTIKSAQARKEKFKADDNFKKEKHLGWGSYNKDGVPVYENDIDYKGDFGWANLKTLSDDDLTKALNIQSEEYHKANAESVGDRRTRNGRMDKIFKDAKVGKYEQGMKKINEEMQNRNMPRYNIYDKKNPNNILVSSPTKEMADKQIQDMYKTDISLQKEYGWKELPRYDYRVGKVDENLNEIKETINNYKKRKGK